MGGEEQGKPKGLPSMELTAMKIGLIGAGYIGRALAGVAVKLGHDVMVSNSRSPDTLFTLVNTLGVKVGTAEQAAAFGDVVIVAIPLKAYRSLPADRLAGKIVIDANNYYPQRDGHIAALDNHSTTTSELLAAHLSTAKVVKAFNAIVAGDIGADGRPAGSPDRRAHPIAGDDAAAKAVVAALVEQIGFDVVDTGPLSEGRRFQEGTPAYCVRLDTAGLRAALAAA
jgi:predicted dinucleotide-binding enzyme